MSQVDSTSVPHQVTAARLTQLDGVRALLALWVLFGHVAIFMGCNVPLLNNPAIAVDLFMVLSGLFIASTFESLQQRHRYVRATVYFWIRRIMRIWPLYAILLTVCWSLIGHFDHWMQLAATTFPRAGGYVTPTYHAPTISSLLMHYSMLFGLVPSMATSTPLPDWSLSLEFQFYLIFPILFLALRSRLLLVCLLVAGLAYVSPILWGFYMQPGRLAHFEQPSVLTYKLNLFLVGVFIHALLNTKREINKQVMLRLLVAVIICLAVAGFLTTLGIALIVYLLVLPNSTSSVLLSTPVPRFYGAISYTIYLVHRPLLLWIVGTLAVHHEFVALPAIVRFAGVSITLLVLTTSVSWVLYNLIERPCNRLSHRYTSTGMDGELPVSNVNYALS